MSYYIKFNGFIIVRGHLDEVQRNEINKKIADDHEAEEVTFDDIDSPDRTRICIDDNWRSSEPDYEMWWKWLHEKYDIMDLDVRAMGEDWSEDCRLYNLSYDGDEPVNQLIVALDAWQVQDPWTISKKEEVDEDDRPEVQGHTSEDTATSEGCAVSQPS